MAAAAARPARTARSMSATRARTPGGAVDAPGRPPTSDRPGRRRTVGRRCARRTPARRRPGRHQPRSTRATCTTQTVILGRGGTTSSCSFKVSASIPRDQVNLNLGGATLPAGVEQLHFARRMVLVRRRRRPVRRHLPGLGGQPGQSDPGGGLRVGELLRGLSARAAAPAATASTRAAPAGDAPAARARPACTADSPARRPPSAVPGRARTDRVSARWAASVSRRPAARRANAATGAASAPSIRSSATPAA